MSRRLTINSLGEVFIGDAYIGGDVNVSNLATQLGREPDQDDFDAALDAQIAYLEEAPLIRVVWAAQRRHDRGDIRVCYYDGAVRVTTEFRPFTDQTDAIAQIYAAAADLKANVTIMDEGEHLDRSCRPGEDWIEGPDHGRPYIQFDLNVTPGTEPGAIDAAVAAIEARIASIPDEHKVYLL